MHKGFFSLALSGLIIFALGPSSWGQDQQPVVTYYRFQNSAYPGGFSGMAYLGEKDSEHRFLVANDQGPKSQISETLLRWLEIETDSETMNLKVISETLLKDPQGKLLTGADIDPEGITIDDQGYRWMCEETIPSLLKFSPQGILLKRYIPQGALSRDEVQALEKKYQSPGILVESLPKHFSLKETNRGFEGITFAHGKIYASLQKPLGKKQRAEDRVRILEFDIIQESVTREFFYHLSTADAPKIGDMAYSPDKDRLYVIEQNSSSGSKGLHFLSETLLSSEVLQPVQRADLKQPHYEFAEKIEGLAFISSSVFAFINDNDFKPEIPTVLGIIHLNP